VKPTFTVSLGSNESEPWSEETVQCK